MINPAKAGDRGDRNREATPLGGTRSFEALLETLMLGTAMQSGKGPTFQNVADEHPDVMARIPPLSPVQAAASFAGLLTDPELQGSCFRLETLVHLALMGAKGRDKPSGAFVRSAFMKLGEGFCGRMEDPTEDVFVGSVRTPRGNFRVLEGMWEGNAFYLQRFLNIIEAMPDGSGYDDLRDSVYALLTLSDLICERGKLGRYQLGAELPVDRLSAKTIGTLGAKASR